MVATSDLINSYDYVTITSSEKEIFNYATCQDFSDSLYWQNLSIISPFPITIYNSSEVYLDDICIGYYFKDIIDKNDKSVTYNLKLYNKDILPENFDFHFKDNGFFTKCKKILTSGLGSLYNKKMIIDPK